ncbi:MAG: UDP-N-acetylmuramoyl-L-alanine--D-glutamate ligase [Candidatus Omnitrophota bacterium]
MNIINVKNKKVLVLGLGVSGYAAAKLLTERGAKVKVSEASDNGAVQDYSGKLQQYSIPCEMGGHTKGFCEDAEIVVISPGISLSKVELSKILHRNAAIMGELELGFLFCRAPIIAITGTNGKSTVTKLIGNILSVGGRHTVVSGNIGNPLSGEVDLLTETSLAVVEVSSFQLETIKHFKPYIAVLLNVTEDHYERHTNYDEYKAVKFKIFENQTSDDWAVLHPCFRGDELLSEIKCRCLFYEARQDKIIEDIIKSGEMPLKGVHNIDNAACAAVVARIAGIDDNAIRDGIKNFTALDHRFETIKEFNGIEFIDDSKATNIDAAYQALKSMDKKTILIAGGRDKGGDYLSILPMVKEKVRVMVVMGESASKIKNAFKDVLVVRTAKDMKEAVTIAYSEAKKGEAVILSPMCSSFDMFSSYKERGQVFRKEVNSLTVDC